MFGDLFIDTITLLERDMHPLFNPSDTKEGRKILRRRLTYAERVL